MQGSPQAHALTHRHFHPLCHYLGLHQQGGEPRLEPLADGLSEAMQPAYADFKLEIHAIHKGNQVTLHCILRNISIAESAIDIDASTLPWHNADMFGIDAVSASGKLVHRYIPPVARISGLPTPITIAAGKAIEGEMDLDATPNDGLPRNEDLLLLWASSIRGMHPDNHYVLRGVTFLRASAVADRPSPVSPEMSKSWFNPPCGTWTPDSAAVSDMKVALDEALRPLLEKNGDLTRPPVPYWFQYVGQGSGVNKTISVIGHPIPVSQRAAIEFLGAFIPEACHVLARYVPGKNTIEDLVVGGFGCPRRF